MRKFLAAVSILIAVTGCGGGDVESGGNGVQGTTAHAGFWTLVAKITAIVGGTVNNLNHTTKVKVESNGAVGILSTDSTCGLSIFVNGSIFTYEEVCVFPGAAVDGGDNAACTLKMPAIAPLTSNELGTGTFGPKTEVCTGTATSYSGTLVITRDGAFEDPEPEPEP